MDHRRAFLDAIIANPGDDALRLVYADWLEEYGNAVERDRARFIRLQIELEHVEEDDRRKAIRAECHQLIDAHGQEWTHSFRIEMGAWYFKDAFKRGFLPYLCLKSTDLSNPQLDALMAHEPITRLHISGMSPSYEAFANWKHLPRVRELTFSYSSKYVKALLHSPLLTGLRVFHGYGALDEEDVGLIASDPRFAGLRRLEMPVNRLPDSAVAREFHGFFVFGSG